MEQESKVFQIVELPHGSVDDEKTLLANEIVSKIAGSVSTKIINLNKLNNTNA